VILKKNIPGKDNSNVIVRMEEGLGEDTFDNKATMEEFVFGDRNNEYVGEETNRKCKDGGSNRCNKCKCSNSKCKNSKFILDYPGGKR
jgi:hypothetical protein